MRQKGFTPVIIPILIILIVLIGFIYLSKKENNLAPSPIDTPISTINSNSTPSPVSSSLPESTDQLIFKYGTFSFSYPKSWKLTENTTNKTFFDQNKITGFNHMILLQNADFYLLIGIDNPSTNAEVGGIFTSKTDYSEFLGNNDAITIQGEKFFLWKSHTSLADWNKPNREAGIYALASFSKFIPKKVSNSNEGNSFDGYDQYFQEGGSSYMFIKLSKTGSGSLITPTSIQSDLRGILESIKW